MHNNSLFQIPLINNPEWHDSHANLNQTNWCDRNNLEDFRVVIIKSALYVSIINGLQVYYNWRECIISLHLRLNLLTVNILLTIACIATIYFLGSSDRSFQLSGSVLDSLFILFLLTQLFINFKILKAEFPVDVIMLFV